jgi:excisionase family DNA binding protein
MKRSFSTGEAARLCGLTPSTLRRWVRRGALKAHRTPGGNIRILLEHLLDFLRECDMPVQIADAPQPETLVVWVETPAIRRALLDAAGEWKDRIHMLAVSDHASLAWALEHADPAYVVFEADGRDGARCAQIRRASDIARIAMLVNGRPADPDAQADLTAHVHEAEGAGWAAPLLAELLNGQARTGADSKETSDARDTKPLDPTRRTGRTDSPDAVLRKDER